MRHETMPEQALLFLVLFLPFVVSLLLLAGKQIAKRSKTRKKRQQADGYGHDHGSADRRLLPPSPRGLLLIGHLHLVGFLPHVGLRDLAARHGRDGGGLILVRLGSVPTLVVSSRRAAEAVVREHDHLLASRPPSTVADTLLYGSLDVIFAAYGDRWRLAKKLLTAHLLTVRKVQSYRTVREEEVRLAMARVSGVAAAGRALDASELLYGFTFDVMCRAVSGRLIVGVNDMSKLFRELLDDTEALIGGFNAEDYFPWLLRVGVWRRAVCARAKRVRKRWDELLDKVIDDHEGKQLEQQQVPDFIKVLLSHQQEYGLTRDHIKALLIDIFVAGTDTSYIVLEFAMAELVRNPNIMSRLQDEVRHSVHDDRQEMVSEDDITSMIYLKAVIKETLRLHPPAPLLAPHYSVTETHIDGYMVPAKTPILVNAWALGRDTSVWEDAEEFKPERFMSTGSDEAAINFKGNDFQFLPFGAGRRMCPGINFSLSSIEIMLANLVHRFNWEVPTVMGSKCLDMTEVFWLTLRRKEKLLLVPKMVDL